MAERIVEQPAADQIGGLARKGVKWSAGLIAVRQILGLLVTSILARLLLPADYGLIGMVSTLFALLSTFGSMGLSSATVQRKHLTEAQTHNLFWINAGVGLALSGVVVALAPVLADFYGEERLTAVAIVLAAGFTLNGTVVQPLALMSRQMRFGSVTSIQLAEFLTGSIVAIALAAAGAGYWALVGQTVSAQVVRITLAFRLSGYRPRMPRRNAGTMGLLAFGGYITASGFMIYFQRNLDNVLIGRMLGAVDLGHYSRAYFLMMLPSMLASGALGGVMVPSLAALQHDTERFGRAYRKAVRWMALLAFPVAGGLGLVAHEAVRLVYGDTWMPVVPILAWLSLVSVTQPVYNTYGWLFTAAGKGRAYLISTTGATVVLVAAFAVGIQSGVVSLSAWYALAMTFVVTPSMLYLAHRAAGISLSATLRAIAPAGAATAIMATTVFLTGLLLDSAGIGWPGRLATKFAVGVIVYLPLLFAWDPEFRGMAGTLWARRPLASARNVPRGDST